MSILPKPQITDALPISLRAFAQTPNPAPKRSKASHPKSYQLAASDWTLIFDCETTTGASQHLRFGTYQVRKGGQLKYSGIFYDPANVTQDELDNLHRFADQLGLSLLTVAKFIEQVFFRIGYQLRATIIGFNLPFDLTRIAIRDNPAKGSMRAGFSLTLSDKKYHPHVQVKHLSSKAAFIQFTAPPKQRANRSQQKRGIKDKTRRGHFIDVKTLACALFAKPFSLKSLCTFLVVENPKLDFEDFDAPITNQMIHYAVRDTQATWECYQKLIDRYEALKLTNTPPEKIYSEAGIGKGYLKIMGIEPWQKCQPSFDPKITGFIMSSYFGGRAEIKIRRKIKQVMLCDFLSMYPTVCTLMGLWRYVIASGIKTRDATKQAQALLEKITLEQLQSKAIWRKLTILVRVKPDADIFPIRTYYQGSLQSNIGLNCLSCDDPLWFTLADCIAAKLLTGKTPEIVEAIGFSPKPKQRHLSEIKINGNSDYTIDPIHDDFYKRLIELRHEIKGTMKSADDGEKQRLDIEQNALKIAANATSYGIFVELNVGDAKSKTKVRVYHSGDTPFDMFPSKMETPGSYFNPLLATLITGAARLMLAITERLATERRLDWSFCDTDSMAFAKPDNMIRDEFIDNVKDIAHWFAGLNPYAFGGTILKSEDVNREIGTDELQPLYCFAVSAKRYALFNMDSEGNPILRKASAHGLGHLRAPYDETNPAKAMKPPVDKLENIGVQLWQHDLWIKIIEAAQSRQPNQIDLSYHPALQLPAIRRYAATSPAMKRWFKSYNKDRAYAYQVKPFNFLTALSMKKINCDEQIIDNPHKRQAKGMQPKPIAPFTDDPAKAADTAFDRKTGMEIPPEKLQTYAQSLAQYHLHPENKFLNGDYLDTGMTGRRHVKVIGICNIGKESNDWERQAKLGYDASAQPTYGYCPNDITKLQRELERLCDIFSKHEIARYGGITANRIAKFVAAESDSEIAAKNAGQMEKLALAFADIELRQMEEIDALKRRIAKHGLRKTAKQLEIDPSNLRRKLM